MEARRSLTRAACFVAPAFLAILWFVVPLVAGGRTLVLRDVLNTHYLLRASLGTAIALGELPIVDPLRSGGAPLAGNPNAVPFYPDNLLLVVADTLWQMNLHFALHWLVAFVGAWRLGRRWGLGIEGAAGCAAAFALSGYWFSQMNLYNAVAVVALAPWLWSALLASGDERGGRRAAAAAGLLWGFALLGGDPILAVLALAGGLAVALGRHGRRLPVAALALALGIGTVVAAPQIVETLRIYATSYRGVFGYPQSDAGTRAPAALVDLAIPLFFGRPDRLSLWGEALFGGYPPLYFTLYPGVVAAALALAAGRPRRREAVVLAVASGLALVLVYSGGTPLPGWIGRMPGGSAFRFFEKLALLPALGFALAAGTGAQRLAAGGAARVVARAAGVLGLPVLALWLGFGAGGERAERWFGAVFAGAASESIWSEQRLRWAGLAMFVFAAIVLALGVLGVTRRRGAAAVAALLALHALSQAFLLGPLAVTDDAAVYRSPPKLAASIPPDRVLAHGALTRFDAGLNAVIAPDELAERRYFWLQRRAHHELLGFSAVASGRRLELAISPEGLDPFVTQALVYGFAHFSDARRIALLAATGVDDLVVARALEPEGAGGAVLAAEPETLGRSVRIYEIPESLPEAALAGMVVRAPHVNAALEAIWAPEFHPARVAVVAGEGPARSGPPGAVRILDAERERVVAEVDSEAGGVLVLRRAHLPIWEATVDGRPAPTVIAQVTRLGVEVPAGRHRVELAISRRPLALSLVAALLALGALAAMARGVGRGERA